MRLLADIGGTNARFALADRDGTVHARQQLAVANHPRFEDALATYLSSVAARPGSAALSVAGPVIGNAVIMTNTAWVVSDNAVRSVCPDIPVAVVNDLQAVALAVPSLGSSDFKVLHAGQPPFQHAAVLCINLGTGFGAAVACPEPDGGHALATEAGHMTLATTNAHERTLLGDGVTVEEVFSGPGLRILRERSAEMESSPDAFRQTYSHVLGRLAGDLALATGAWGGIALCGGVLTDLDAVVDLTSFLAGLHTRQGLARRLESVPVRHVTCADPAFLGLMRIDLGEAG